MKYARSVPASQSRPSFDIPAPWVPVGEERRSRKSPRPPESSERRLSQGAGNDIENVCHKISRRLRNDRPIIVQVIWVVNSFWVVVDSLCWGLGVSGYEADKRIGLRRTTAHYCKSKPPRAPRSFRGLTAGFVVDPKQTIMHPLIRCQSADAAHPDQRNQTNRQSPYQPPG